MSPSLQHHQNQELHHLVQEYHSRYDYHCFHLIWRDLKEISSTSQTFSSNTSLSLYSFKRSGFHFMSKKLSVTTFLNTPSRSQLQICSSIQKISSATKVMSGMVLLLVGGMTSMRASTSSRAPMKGLLVSRCPFSRNPYFLCPSMHQLQAMTMTF